MTSPSPALPPTPPPPNPLTLGYVRIAAYAVVTAVALGTPFALQAGAEFFLPITAAIVVAIALVPALEWLERRGVPSGLAALACVLSFLLLINGGLALIVVPASGWFVRLPESLPRIQANLAPLIDFYASLQRYVDEALTAFADNTAAQMQQVAVQTPTSLLDYLTGSAPAAAIQTLFSILLIYFFLAGWTRLRGRTIRSRGSFDDAMNTARVIQNVVDATSAYLSTIVFINAMLGLSVALLLWALGMPSPFMWGGIVTLCNFIPYVGPIVAAGLLGIGGLMTFDSVGLALLPAMIQIGLHTVEANIVTPLVLGRRLTINPMLILISLSFWGWVWGTPGALLAVPILIIAQTLFLSFRGERPEWAPPVSRVDRGEEENVANAGAGG
jgi:predicted PurR-regulated permease PerM